MLKSKWVILVILVFIFLMPGVCAFWFYQHPTWLGAKTINKGRLLTPPVVLPQLPKTAKWGLLSWNPGPCGKECRGQLNKISRIRLALGRRLYEVNLWAATPSQNTLSRKSTVELLKAQGITPIVISQWPMEDHQSQLFIITPDNQLILRYSLEANPADVYSDLQRVMNLQRNL
jgi:hypothetical protein